MKTSAGLIIIMILVFNVSLSSQHQVSDKDNDDNAMSIRYEFAMNDQGSNVLNIFVPSGKDFESVRLKGFSIGEAYLVSGWLSDQFIDTVEVIDLRSQEILQIFFDPYIRLSDGKKLKISSVDLEISLMDGSDHEKYLKSGVWQQILAGHVMNPEMIFQQSFSDGSLEDDGAEYIIICPEIFEQQLQALKTWRLCEGIETEIYTTQEIGTTVSEISNFISNAYFTWTVPPAAVLLVGDHELIPAPVWDNYCLSDNLYADVDGNDLPDLIMSRLPASDAIELETYLTRIFAIETNPPEDPSYYDHPLAATSFQNPGSVSWMVSEILNGWYQHEMEKEPVRVYDGSDAPDVWPDEELFAIFGPDGLNYITESPDYLGNYGGGNATMMNAALNSGAMSWFVYTQGSATGWGAPEYQLSDLSGLNGALPSFLVSMSSLTGEFGSAQDCIAEAYLLHPFGGTGVVAPTEIIYAFAAQWYAIGLADGLWDDFLPGISNRFLPDNIYLSKANVSAKFFLEMYPGSINPSVKEAFFHLFHHFGAPFVPVFDDVPQEILVLHGEHIFPGQTAFEVHADSGAVVSLMLNGEINAVMLSTGGNMVLPLFDPEEGDTLHVTATRHNYKRYHAQVICSQSSNLENTREPGIKLSPNPTAGFFDVIFPGRVPEISSFQMLDVFGNAVKTCKADIQTESNRIRVDASGIREGLYIIKMKTLNHEITHRILILR